MYIYIEREREIETETDIEVEIPSAIIFMSDVILSNDIPVSKYNLTLSNNVLVFPVPGGPTTLYRSNSYLPFYLLVYIQSYLRVAVLVYKP